MMVTQETTIIALHCVAAHASFCKACAEHNSVFISTCRFSVIPSPCPLLPQPAVVYPRKLLFGTAGSSYIQVADRQHRRGQRVGSCQGGHGGKPSHGVPQRRSVVPLLPAAGGTRVSVQNPGAVFWHVLQSTERASDDCAVQQGGQVPENKSGCRTLFCLLSLVSDASHAHGKPCSTTTNVPPFSPPFHPIRHLGRLPVQGG